MGGLVLRADPATGRALVVPEVEDGAPVVDLVAGAVWAVTSDARLLGLGGPQVLGPRRNLHELDSDRITAVAAAADGGCGWGRPRGCSTSTRASWAGDSPARRTDGSVSYPAGGGHTGGHG